MKRTLPIVILTASAVLAWLYFATSRDVSPVTDVPSRSPDTLRFKADPGLVIDYAEAGDVPEEFVGERIVYEAYRLLPPVEECADEEDLACAIDLRREDIRVFVTAPNGVQRELGHETLYYLMPLYPYPFVEGGTYAFRVETSSGESRTGSLSFSPVSVPQQDPTTALAEDGSITAFSDLKLSADDVVLHVLPVNAVIARAPGADGVVRLQRDDVQEEGEHVFLVKVEGEWRYAVHFTPETE